MEASGGQIVRAVAGPLLGTMLALGVPASVGVDARTGLDWIRVVPPPDLLDGDLVFRRGVDAIGRIVLSYGEQPRFSHVGIAVRMAEEVFVVHALPETPGSPGGVRLDQLAFYTAPVRAADVGYYRMSRMTDRQRSAIREYLLDRLGTPFDPQFEYSTDGALYCTELALKALAHSGIELSSSIRTVDVMMLEEPAFAPDSLRQARGLQEL